MGRCQFKPAASAPLLQRRIGLCGDATRAPTGACKQQKGRAVFITKVAPARLLLLEQEKSEKSTSPKPKDVQNQIHQSRPETPPARYS
jgi:hypothetical protein